MDLNSFRRNGFLVIAVAVDRIDAAVAIQFKDAMRGLTGSASGRVVLDLEQVNFIDSSGLGAIVASMKSMPGDSSLELAALAPAVEKVFRLTRMDSVFRIHRSADSAVTT